jgi:hypothetical protein
MPRGQKKVINCWMTFCWRSSLESTAVAPFRNPLKQILNYRRYCGRTFLE